MIWKYVFVDKQQQAETFQPFEKKKTSQRTTENNNSQPNKRKKPQPLLVRLLIHR